MEKIYSYIDEHLEEYIARLADICRIPTVSKHGQGIEEGAAFVSSMLERLGASIEHVSTGDAFPLVVGTVPGQSSKTVVLYNHYDVVPAEPLEDWTQPPFSPQIRDGKMIARGVCDNKGDLIARLCAAEAYQAVYGQLPLTVKFVVDGEEEIGSPHLRQTVEVNQELLGGDACFGEGGHKDKDGQPEITLGIRGRVNMELEVSGAARSFHSSLTSIVPNPTWDLVWALASLKDRQECVTIEGFYDDAVAPTQEEMGYLERIAFDEAGTLERLELPQYTLGVTGVELMRRLLFEPTCEVSELGAGPLLDGLQGMPRKAVGGVRFGLVPNQRPEKMVELLRQHLERLGFGNIHLKVTSWRHPGKTSIDTQVAQTLIAVTQEVYGVEPVIYPVSPGLGGLPIYELSEPLHMPCLSIGVSSFDSKAHAPDESLRLDDFQQGIKLMACFMRRFAEAG